MINGKTKLMGLMGNPVEHTLSPFIHNMIAKELEMNTVYVPLFVEKGQLHNAVAGALALNFLGTNVTVPYKTEVMPFLDVIDERAKTIGAVNTIHYKEGKTYGYNTDLDGLYHSCIRAGISFEGKSACILGAGGAAKSVAVMCVENNVKSMVIVNRTLEKAYEMKALIQEKWNIPIEVVSYEELPRISHVDLCFQTTNKGMFPNVHEQIIEDDGFFDHIGYAIDLIYNPEETIFLKQAKSKQVPVLNGLGMLYFQALRAFEIWHGVTIPEAIREECLTRFYDFVYKKKG